MKQEKNKKGNSFYLYPKKMLHYALLYRDKNERIERKKLQKVRQKF